MKWIEIQLIQQQFGVQCQSNYNYGCVNTPTFSELTLLGDEWVSEVLSAINGLQHADVYNISCQAILHGSPYRTVNINVAGGGALAIADDEKPMTQMAFYFREFVGETKAWADDEIISDRAIKRGALFLAGINDAFMYDGHFVRALDYTAEIVAVEAALVAEVVQGSNTLIPIVHGWELEATIAPVQAYRPECYAPIEYAVLQSATWLRNRKP